MRGEIVDVLPQAESFKTPDGRPLRLVDIRPANGEGVLTAYVLAEVILK
ncbi:hypothetical protein KC906_02730 [Candidatus Kaiserbacteria bacterium]|nr:hypothetical protein [Candidatus Kaiserbacteria bacterium]